MRNSIFLVLFISFIFFNCQKEKGPYVPITRSPDLTRNIDTISKYIHGTWRFVEELRITRGIGIRYLTPDSAGFGHWILKLSGDTATFFVNNVRDSSYRFKIQRELEITNYPTDSMPCLAYYRFYSGQLISYVPIKISSGQLLEQCQFVDAIAGERLWIRN